MRSNIKDSRELSGNAEPVTLIDDDGRQLNQGYIWLIDARQGWKEKRGKNKKNKNKKGISKNEK